MAGAEQSSILQARLDTNPFMACDNDQPLISFSIRVTQKTRIDMKTERTVATLSLQANLLRFPRGVASNGVAINITQVLQV